MFHIRKEEVTVKRRSVYGLKQTLGVSEVGTLMVRHSVLILHANGASQRRKRDGMPMVNNTEIQQVGRVEVPMPLLTGISGNTH